MITTNKDGVVTLQYGLGTVGTNQFLPDNNQRQIGGISMRTIPKHKTGDLVDVPEGYKALDDAEVILIFQHVQSIDVLINTLQKTRSRMIFEEGRKSVVQDLNKTIDNMEFKDE